MWERARALKEFQHSVPHPMLGPDMQECYTAVVLPLKPALAPLAWRCSNARANTAESGKASAHRDRVPPRALKTQQLCSCHVSGEFISSFISTSARASERPVSAHRGAMTSADLPAPLESAAASSSLHPVTQRRLRPASGYAVASLRGRRQAACQDAQGARAAFITAGECTARCTRGTQ